MIMVAIELPVLQPFSMLYIFTCCSYYATYDDDDDDDDDEDDDAEEADEECWGHISVVLPLLSPDGHHNTYLDAFI